MKSLNRLSDKDLLSRTQRLRKKEQKLLLELLLHIAEVDARKLYRDAGYSSLYSYLIEGLKYSESASHRRIQVARAVQKFPDLLEALRHETLSFSAVYEISRVVTHENVGQLVHECTGRSRADVERVIALLGFGGATPGERTERVQILKATSSEAASQILLVDSNAPTNSNDDSNPTSAAEVEVPLKYRVTLEVDEEFIQLYQKVKAISGGRRMEGALKKSMREYLKQNDPQERELRRQKRKAKREEKEFDFREVKRSVVNPRYIPLAVRDTVFMRDAGRCTYVSKSGSDKIIVIKKYENTIIPKIMTQLVTPST